MKIGLIVLGCLLFLAGAVMVAMLIKLIIRFFKIDVLKGGDL